MAAVAVDTHAIIWYLTGDPRLSAKAAAALDGATLWANLFTSRRSAWSS
jgi:PIN domain nuclease of toxin-antitoxin system